MSTLPALYQLAKDFRETELILADMDVDDETLADTLDAARAPLEVKARNVAMFALNCEALAEQIKQAEAKMKRRREQYERRAQSLRRYVQGAMEFTGTLKIKSPEIELAIKKNPPSVVIEDEAAIPPEFWRQPPAPPPEINRKALLEELKAGNAIDGVKLEANRTRLEIK